MSKLDKQVAKVVQSVTVGSQNVLLCHCWNGGYLVGREERDERHWLNKSPISMRKAEELYKLETQRLKTTMREQP